MPNLTIENLAGSLQSGKVNELLGGGKESLVAPEALTLRNMQAEGMTSPDASGAEGAKGFGQMLSDSIAKVNDAQISADTSIKELAAGRTKNIHETMLQIENADASLKLMMQVRNKVLDAYKEIMRMQV